MRLLPRSAAWSALGAALPDSLWPPRWPPSKGLVIASGLVAGDLGLRLAALYVVPRNRRPSSAISWLLAINLIPYAGPAAFALIGSPNLPRGRREAQREIDQLIVEGSEGSATDLSGTEPAWLATVAHLNRRLGAMPLLGGNSASVHNGTRDNLAGMIADVDAATTSVHAEFYLISLDATTEPFFDALGHAVARGVRVRLLMDHVTCLRYPGYRATTRRLDAMGVDWRPMLPLQPLRGKLRRPDLRNHRKQLIVDGTVGWMGSQNIIDPSYNQRANIERGLQWVDIMARFVGPVVAELDGVFATDWYSETGDLLELERARTDMAHHHPDGSDQDLDCQVVPSGPAYPVENNLKLFNAMLYAAQRTVTITTPYFVPDESLLEAVTTAAQRGLHVELLVCEEGDQAVVHHAQSSYYEALLRAGVRIWLFPRPYVLHAKLVTVDDVVSVIGSSNMDIRSFDLDLEVSVMVRSTSFAAELLEVQEEYRSRCRELTLEDYLRRPRLEQLKDNLARLTSALQ